MVSSHSAATARPQQVSLRRRGPVLERAILDAALEQLSTVGWNGLTMEGVAAAAQTGKAAVYRRWPSKEDLVVEALRDGLPTMEEPPDLGSVRADLYELCAAIREGMYSRTGAALRAVLHECDGSSAERFHELIISSVIEPSTRLFGEVVRRGIARGEVRSDAADAMVYDVIPALMMYRTKVCASDWADVEIAEVIDKVMMPLLRQPSG
ncbi:TetR family transcriptional regulator [Streptomyces sp. AcH 505]|uniref:TetR/AcrR family transcriptional regulator n=1 Tax=Streptomyces sp. AcH 505 TaxID=352211 RepID=UPI000591C1FD|nr:TetR family transcriptional regulator [Streptomyces sp. AcH 505]